ncbi:hypothetical protein BJF90_13445 [Pseudonocardia sp. CNS-004]|nr:hypothetical protein BJF90_13445 [Pseudonocardia sp. CNS-004]
MSVFLLLSGCAAAEVEPGGQAAGADGSNCGQMSFTAPGGSADLSQLPDKLREGYSGYFAPVNTSEYQNFRSSSDGPFTIGYSDSFSGNSWRAGALARLQQDVATYKQAGLTDNLVAMNSNLDNTLQIQQISAMINEGVDAIIAIPNSPTAFNDVIEQAHRAGIPFITLASHVTSPYAINVDSNYVLTGEMVAGGVAKALGGQGNAIIVDGINGAPASAALHAGYEAAFAKCPGINVLGSVEGQWSEATTKTAMLQFLSTHPTQVDGVVNGGGETLGVMQAMEQVGRPLPFIGDSNPDKGSLVALQKSLADRYAAASFPPDQAIDAAFTVAIATLQGQGPRFDAVVGGPPLVTGADALGSWVQPDWSESSSDQAPASPGAEFLPAADLGAFFTSPQPLPPLQAAP